MRLGAQARKPRQAAKRRARIASRDWARDLWNGMNWR